MVFPVIDIVKPAALYGQQNGKLESRILSVSPGQAGGPSVTLVRPADRAWRALCAEAKKHRHILKISGGGSAYRNYDIQRRIFLERYRTAYKPNTDVKVWEGRTWYRWYGAIAAAPGKSNHGWGLAVDTGEENDGDLGVESVDAITVAWLVANERRFGWSHELQSEPWHIHYWAGDKIPQAVLDYEASLEKPEPTPEPETDQDYMEDHMLYKTKAGSILQLLEGKLIVVVDALDGGVSDEEEAQLMYVQAGLPEGMREPVVMLPAFQKRMLDTFPVVR